jgi:hypothetical protein
VRERRTLKGEPIAVRTPRELGLVLAPPTLPADAKVSTVVQWIEGELYQWDEFVTAGATLETVDDGDSASVPGSASAGRIIRLRKPEQRVLSVDEAAVLLSASTLWQRQPVQPANPVYYDPPAEVRPLEIEDAPRRDGPIGPETEITGRP